MFARNRKNYLPNLIQYIFLKTPLLSQVYLWSIYLFILECLEEKEIQKSAERTFLCTKMMRLQQPDTHRGFREDSTCPEWNVNQQTSHSWFRLPALWTTALEMSKKFWLCPQAPLAVSEMPGDRRRFCQTHKKCIFNGFASVIKPWKGPNHKINWLVQKHLICGCKAEIRTSNRQINQRICAQTQRGKGFCLRRAVWWREQFKEK